MYVHAYIPNAASVSGATLEKEKERKMKKDVEEKEIPSLYLRKTLFHWEVVCDFLEL